MHLNIEGLDEYVEQVVEAKVAAALDSRADVDGWFTADEAADYLKVARSTIHDLVSAGRLPRHGEKGFRLRFRRADLDAYVGGRGR